MSLVTRHLFTFHLHISGRVQGVGFRPYVYNLACNRKISGTVSNEGDGVHIYFNASDIISANDFAKELINHIPEKAIVTDCKIEEVSHELFTGFRIISESRFKNVSQLISPDYKMCDQCSEEFSDPANRRYMYPFITCTQCGPRFSIIETLPYDRHATSMASFEMCAECLREYHDVNDMRYFSQTNSCNKCGIKLRLLSKNESETAYDADIIQKRISDAFNSGEIIAVKGIGGFLLMCDATNAGAIKKLRDLKHRPRKPFAVLFRDEQSLKEYAVISEYEIKCLKSECSPVVIVTASEDTFNLAMEQIAPGLNSIGVMLPYAPLLKFISGLSENPLIATSANDSGSTIISDSEMTDELFKYAGYVLDHNRKIISPQDDSVMRITPESKTKIIIRRSRGIAPSFITLSGADKKIFAAGAMMKSAFAFQSENNIYISQYLGNLQSYESELLYRKMYDQFIRMIKILPEEIVCDLHPDYPSAKFAHQLAADLNIPLHKIQHHEAHFASVLGENDLLKSQENILGVIWDGTGLGTDDSLWGGEFFLYNQGTMQRVNHLESFVNLSGDQMALQPRLSAFSLSQSLNCAEEILSSKFTMEEWKYYNKAINLQSILNNSAGRYFDAVASLLGFADISSYEGEAATFLEQSARSFYNTNILEIVLPEIKTEHVSISMKIILQNIIDAITAGKDKAEIAFNFHLSMVVIIAKLAEKTNVKHIALSGGVFQNSLLVDLLILLLGKKYNIYFHKQLSPNDENIAYGQIIHRQFIKSVDIKLNCGMNYES